MRKGRSRAARKDSAFKSIILVAAILVLAISSIAIYQSQRHIETKVIEVRYEIGSNAGFDLNSSVLTFGRITPGGSGTRSINLTNAYDFPVSAIFYPSDNLESILSYKHRIDGIAPGESEMANFTLRLPVDATEGNHTGSIVVKIIK